MGQIKGFLILITIMFLASAHVSHAQSICDPEYMDAIEARGWLEAQSGGSQFRNLIVKPDSVLEYTCFNKFIEETGNRADSMWGASTDNAIQMLTFSALGSYLSANFAHTYLGGKTAAVSGSGLSSSPSTYSCTAMIRVWNMAREVEFMAPPVIDGFFDFPYYAGNDPRQHPSAISSPTSDYNDNMQIAFNGNMPANVLTTENPNDSIVVYNKSPVVLSWFTLLLPDANCPSCPIPTGVEVNRIGKPPISYDDHICTNPGCYYDYTTNTCVQ